MNTNLQHENRKMGFALFILTIFGSLCGFTIYVIRILNNTGNLNIELTA